MKECGKTVAEKLGGLTCLAERDGKVIFSSAERGIGPALELAKSGLAAGATVFDLIVGKAAALLYVAAGAARVFASVMTEDGAAALRERNIPCEGDTVVPAIINRKGTGKCPMELAVEDIEEPAAAVAAVERKLAAIKQKQTPKEYRI